MYLGHRSCSCWSLSLSLSLCRAPCVFSYERSALSTSSRSWHVPFIVFCGVVRVAPVDPAWHKYRLTGALLATNPLWSQQPSWLLCSTQWLKLISAPCTRALVSCWPWWSPVLPRRRRHRWHGLSPKTVSLFPFPRLALCPPLLAVTPCASTVALLARCVTQLGRTSNWTASGALPPLQREWRMPNWAATRKASDCLATDAWPQQKPQRP